LLQSLIKVGLLLAKAGEREFSKSFWKNHLGVYRPGDYWRTPILDGGWSSLAECEGISADAPPIHACELGLD